MGGKLSGEEIFLFVIFSGIRRCLSPHLGKRGQNLGTDRLLSFRVSTLEFGGGGSGD